MRGPTKVDLRACVRAAHAPFSVDYFGRYQYTSFELKKRSATYKYSRAQAHLVTVAKPDEVLREHSRTGGDILGHPGSRRNPRNHAKRVLFHMVSASTSSHHARPWQPQFAPRAPCCAGAAAGSHDAALLSRCGEPVAGGGAGRPAGAPAPQRPVAARICHERVLGGDGWSERARPACRKLGVLLPQRRSARSLKPCLRTVTSPGNQSGAV